MHRILTAGLLVLAACSAKSEGDHDGDPISNTVGDWSGDLSAMSGSSVTGTAKVQSVAVGAGATISISGATPGAQHPWHIHRGTCGSNGPIVGNAGSYPVLSVGADGRAAANASIGAALVEETPYYVNVHLSPGALGTIVACGEIDND